jgi:putative transposase
VAANGTSAAGADQTPNCRNLVASNTGSQFTLPLIGDKAYDADPLLDTLIQHEITPVIPPKANRKTPRTCVFVLYCERNLVERFFNKLKHFRAIATRYDKLARNFLAGVHFACAIILLN